MIKVDEWCIKQHNLTNHQYDTYLPYEFHLRLVHKVYETYRHLLDDEDHSCYMAVWGHDLLEDTRVSYNDIKDKLGHAAAEIIYAVTNLKGRTRADRANDEYYKGIRATKGATFVKLCDRIANVEYSILTKSRMTKMYHDEQENFQAKLYTIELDEMWDYLNLLFVEYKIKNS